MIVIKIMIAALCIYIYIHYVTKYFLIPLDLKFREIENQISINLKTKSIDLVTEIDARHYVFQFFTCLADLVRSVRSIFSLVLKQC